MPQSADSLKLQKRMLESLGFGFVEEGVELPEAPPPPAAPTRRPAPERRPSPPPPAAITSAPPAPLPVAKGPRIADLPVLGDADRAAALEEIAQAAAVCSTCHLHFSRKHAVPGEGSATARLLVIGESPGAEDDAAAKPFASGELGELLTNILKAVGFTREEVFVTHAAKCRAPGGRNPSAVELAACAGYLARQVETIRPEVIICFGGAALEGLFPAQGESSLAKVRGTWMDYRGIPVMPTFSLPYISRNKDRKKVVWGDLQEVIKKLKG